MSARVCRPASSLPLVALALVCFACRSVDDVATAGSGLVEEREMVGDTTIVRIVSGSEWGAPATLVEELRIGSLEGAEENIFGRVSAIAPDGEGGAYVFDYQVPALRHYDATGRYLGTVGGEGQGPGEYGNLVISLDVLDDGRLFLRDRGNNRVNFYSLEGEFLDSWLLRARSFSSQSTTVDSVGHVFVKTRLETTDFNDPPEDALIHVAADGRVLDTIPPPRYEGEPTGSMNGTFIPAKEWTFDRWRRLIIGVSDRYEFEVRRPDGAVVRVVKEDWSPVIVHPEERAERQAVLDWQDDRLRSIAASNPGAVPDIDFVPVPDRKPAFTSFRVGVDGTIWVMLHASGEAPDDPPEPRDENEPPPIRWREPPVYDVFRGDGTYLGRVEPPSHTRPYTFSLDTLWGVRTGDFDEQYVVRLRLVEPDDDAEATAAAPGSR